MRFVIAIILALSIRCSAAYTLIGHAAAVSATQATTTAADTTGSDLIILVQNAFAGAAGLPTDSKINTWHCRTQRTQGSINTRICYATKHDGGFTVGTGHTFSTNASDQFSSLQVAWFSGSLTSADPFDVESSGGTAASGSTTVQTGSATASQNNSLYAASVADEENQTRSINLSFTITDQSQDATPTALGGALAYLVLGTAAAENPTWTYGVMTIGMAASLVVFKPAAAAGPPAGQFPRIQ